MRKGFFLGLALVVGLIWGPMLAWSRVESLDPWLDGGLRIALIAGIALGGYLLWSLVMRALLGPDKE